MRERWIVPVCLGLAVWFLVDVGPRARLGAGASHRTDLTVFTTAGAAFFDGRDPYDVPNARGWYYPYPPLFAILISPLAPLDSRAQAAVWFALSVLMGFGCLYECRRLLRWWRGDRRDPGSGGRLAVRRPPSPPHAGSWVSEAARRWIVACAVVAVALPALNCLQRGQVGFALVYPLLLGVRLAATGRSGAAWFSGGILLALPVVIKLTPAVPVAFFLLAQLVRAAAGDGLWRRSLSTGAGVAAGMVLFVLAVPSAMIGWEANLRHLETWHQCVGTKLDSLDDDVDDDRDTSGFLGKPHTRRNQSLSNAVALLVLTAHVGLDHSVAVDRGLLDGEGVAVILNDDFHHVLLAARLALLALLTLVVVQTCRRGGPREEVLAFALASVATLIVSPMTRGHYFLMNLPAVLFIPLWLADGGAPRRVRIVAAVPAVLTMLHYVLLNVAGPVGLLGFGTTGWYLAVCVMASRRARLSQRGAPPAAGGQPAGEPGVREREQEQEQGEEQELSGLDAGHAA